MSGVLNADLVIANVSDAVSMSDLRERGTGVGVGMEVKESWNSSLPDSLFLGSLIVIGIGSSLCSLTMAEKKKYPGITQS